MKSCRNYASANWSLHAFVTSILNFPRRTDHLVNTMSKQRYEKEANCLALRCHSGLHEQGSFSQAFLQASSECGVMIESVRTHFSVSFISCLMRHWRRYKYLKQIRQTWDRGHDWLKQAAFRRLAHCTEISVLYIPYR